MADEQSTPLDTGVYMIRNKVNGKVYVGSASTSLKHRWRQHRCDLKCHRHDNSYLQRAWDKYGKEAFEFAVLERCSPEECIAREQHWIDSKRAIDRSIGYNLSPTAGSSRGIKCSEEKKAKLREIGKNRKLSPEAKAAQAVGLKQRWSRPELRSQHAEVMRKIWTDPEARQRRTDGQRRAFSKPASFAKRSKTARSLWADPAYRDKRAKGMRKSLEDPEVLARKSEGGRRIWDDPAYRAKVMAAREKSHRCKRCGKEYRTCAGPIGLFCTAICRGRYHCENKTYRHPRTCPICGVEFLAAGRNCGSKTCSRVCGCKLRLQRKTGAA